MPRGIDKIDAMIVPLACRTGRHDGNAAFLLFGHEIHSGCAVMHLAHAVDFAAVKQHAFGQGGLACVDMGYDADVADAVNAGLARHGGSRAGWL